MRIHWLPTFLLSAVVATSFSSEAKTVKPTDYEGELAQIQKDIEELQPNAFRTPIDTDKVTRFVYRLYHRASLTGSFAELKFVETAIDQALRLIGTSEDLTFLKANLDLKLHQFVNAKHALAMVPTLATRPQGQTLQADLHLQEGRFEEARTGYTAAIQTQRTWDALARLAYLLARTGDVAGAERLYVEAEDELTSKEMRFYAWVELQRGLLELSHGRHDQAAAHYKQAEKAYSGYWLIDEHNAELLGVQRKFDQAVALYEKVIAQAPRPEFQQELGDLYVFMGQPDRAKPWHEKALVGYLESAQRGEVHYYHHLTTFYADVHENGAEAVKWARKDLALRQNFATQEALAWALYRDGQFVEALGPMNKALASGVQDAHLFFHAAMIHLAAGQADAGRRWLTKAAEFNPHYDRFHVHR